MVITDLFDLRVTNQKIRNLTSSSIVLDELYSCPKTHKYAYNDGKWCCRTNKDCNFNELTYSGICCEHFAFKECPGRKSGRMCKNHKKGKY